MNELSKLLTVPSNHRWVLENRPVGVFKESDVSLVKDKINLDLTPLQEDEVLVEVEMLAVGAFIRTMLDEKAYHGSIDIGDTLPALGYGKVIASGSSKYKKGVRVGGFVGAQTVAKCNTAMIARVLPGIKPSMSLGLLSLTTGITAYVGVYKVAQPPKKGETVVVSAASGAVGSVAAQLAKSTGARVVGIAGGKKKCKFLMENLKLDATIDYKDTEKSVVEQLEETCPDGIDFFFDNVGGELLDHVLRKINPKSRVVICGAISQYSGNLNQGLGKIYGPTSYLKLAEKGASMTGFAVLQYMSSIPMALFWLIWYSYRGKIHMPEQVAPGILSFPSALRNLFTGGHVGKMLVDLKKDD